MSIEQLFLGCFVWVPVSIWVISLLNWWIAGDVDAVTGIGGIGVAIMLGVMTFKPPAPGLAPVMFGTVVVTVLFYPVVRAAMAHRELKAIDIEGVEAGYAILGQRPRDPLGRLKIAKHIYKLGYPGHAIAIMDSILPQLNPSYFQDEHRMVRNWKLQPHLPSAYAPLSCVECGFANPPGNVHCGQCGEPFFIARITGKVLPNTLGRRLLAVWIGLVAVFAGIPFVMSLPSPFAQIAIVMLAALSCLVMIAGFKPLVGANL